MAKPGLAIASWFGGELWGRSKGARLSAGWRIKVEEEHVFLEGEDIGYCEHLR
jgi:hypothetical protein